MGWLLLVACWLVSWSALAQSEDVINTPIVISDNNITIDGVNRRIKLQDNSNCPMFIIGDSDHTEPQFRVSNIIIRNFILDGNGSNQPHEIYTNHINTHSNFMRNNIINVRGATNVLIENCVIVNARSGGVCIEKSSEKVIIRNCILTDSVFDGVAGYYSKNCVIENNIIINNNAAGLSFDLSFNESIIQNNAILNNDVGIFVRECELLFYKNNKIFNKTWDFYFNKSDDNPLTYPTKITFIENQSLKNFIKIQ